MAESCCCSGAGDDSLHPGGLNRTREIFGQLHLPAGCAILDVGCGDGQTVQALSQLGYRAIGIDLPEVIQPLYNSSSVPAGLITGKGEELPFTEGSFACVLFECSLSEMDSPKALSEAARVLAPGGIVVIHDVYDRGARTCCCSAEDAVEPIPSKSAWLALVRDAGFANSTFEERSRDIKELLRRLGAADEACCSSVAGRYDAKRTGYMQIVAQKPAEDAAIAGSAAPELSIGRTKSVCPVCLQAIPAEYIRRDEKVYLRKRCEEHGEFEALIWEDASTFQSWNAASQSCCGAGASVDDCPAACLACTYHKTRPCCVVLQLTERCNLGCPVCFASANVDYDTAGDPTLDEIDAWYAMLVERAGKVNIQLSGGEPTLRDDLEQVIALGKAHGVTYFQLNTNGLRLAREEGYAQKLKDAGLSCVFLQFDGLRLSTYMALRGRNLYEEKCRAIENCSQAHLPVVLVPTIVKGLNEDELGDIVAFAVQKSPTVRGIHIQPVSYFGRCSRIGTERITIPGVLEELEKQTHQMVRASDFVGGSAEHSRCSFSANYRIGADGGLVNVAQQASSSCCCGQPDDGDSTQPSDADATQAAGGTFQEDAVSRAQRIVELRWGTDLESLSGEAARPGSLDAFLQEVRSRSFSITGMAFQDAWTLDLDRLQKCYIFVVDKRCVPIPFCAYNLTAVDGSRLH